VKKWIKIFQTNRLQKQAGIDIAILDKVNFNLVRSGKEVHFILIKGTLQPKEAPMLTYQYTQFC
jgi:hypothetical protein